MKHSAAWLAALAAVAAKLVGATPLVTPESSTPLEKRINSGAPHFVAYWDKWLSGENGPPAPSTVAGFNTLIMAFLLASGSADQVQEWQSLDAGTRSSTHSAYQSAGVNLLVSAFGSTENPTSSGYGAAATASSMASWVKTYNVDGIDVDYEDFTAVNAANGSAESWLITFTQTLRSALPAGQYIITHAPVAPWFSPIYTAGAYTKVHAQVGSLIDWYNVQFYNQGSSEYTSESGLFTASSSQWPSTAVFQINSVAGVPLNKIVVGKPATTADASNGYVDPGTLAPWLADAKNKGWTGGVMIWQFPDGGTPWITQARASSWPVSGSPPPPPPPSQTTTAPSTGPTGGGGGSCSGVGAWNSQTAYTGGQEVVYNNELWKANWWSEADVPGGSSGDWTLVGSC